jgi:hypothetical protein
MSSLSIGPGCRSSQGDPDQLQDVLLARIDTAIRGGHLLACVDDNARQRALRMAPQVLQSFHRAARLVQFANPMLERLEYLGGREDGENSFTMEEIQKLATFGGIDPTIGSSDQGHGRQDRIQQFVFAIIPVLGHHLGRLRAEAAARVTFAHKSLLSLAPCCAEGAGR